MDIPVKFEEIQIVDQGHENVKMDTKGESSNQLEYEVIKKLGQGNYGSVFEYRERISGQHFACKRLGKNNEKAYGCAMEESKILGDFKHPNIVKLEKCFEDEDAYYMVMELCRGMTLLDHIHQTGVFQECQAVKIMADILEAIKYCHDNDVVHNDLKPDNLMYADDKESSPLKLIDFGLAKRFTRGQSFGGPSGDIWAIGVIMYSLLCGYQRDVDYVVRQLVNKGDLLKKAPKMTEAASNLLRWMLAKDADSRPTAQEILDHQWMKVVGPATRNSPPQDCFPNPCKCM